MRQLKGDCGSQNIVFLIPKQYFMPVYIREQPVNTINLKTVRKKLPVKSGSVYFLSQATLSSLGVEKSVALRTTCGSFV